MSATTLKRRLGRVEMGTGGEINGDDVFGALARLQNLLRHGTEADLIAELRRSETALAESRAILSRPHPADREGAIRHELAGLATARGEPSHMIRVVAAIGRCRGITGENPTAWARAAVTHASTNGAPTADAILASMGDQ
jgi:hypothetical protein